MKPWEQSVFARRKTDKGIHTAFQHYGGGGGSSGKVSYPDFIEDHLANYLELIQPRDIVGDDYSGFLLDARNANPYTTMTSYDPSTRIANMEAIVDDLDTLGTNAPTTLWETYEQSASVRFDTDYGQTALDAVVDSMEDGMEVSHLRAMGRFAAQMSEINAVMSSAFLVGMAQMEQEFQRGLTKARVELRLGQEQRRVAYVLQAISHMAGLYQMGYQNRAQGYTSAIEVQRLALIAEKEEKDMDNEFDVADALWDLDIFKYGANLMAAPAGGTAVGREPSKAQTALGGAATGAALGLQAAGPTGAIIGGIGGLIAGFI